MTTTNLFPDVAQGDSTDPADEGPGPEGRWSLHRAGILNVWQYDRVTLSFAGGRMLLRGKNGAGKSKALEVLLPFLFDGDTRQLDATGRDRTTVAWLMTDGRPNGNHVGYLWLELRCLHPDGTMSFQTLGAGLKASTATRRADSWFFITDRRPGVDLDLEVAGECLSLERLKEALGDDAVTTSGAEHRRRVGRHLFGLFDDARYRNLLHLLHRLRDPNIGNRVEAGELASVLTEALPPIDERVLAEAAGHFDDLDSIREQVERSGRTAQALGQFLGAYRGYTRTVLFRRSAAIEEAEAIRARAARATRRLARAVEEAGEAVEQAHAALAAAKLERTEREAERRELERSEGYRSHQDLVDRQERVAALESAAFEAESAAGRAEAAHQRAVTDMRAADGNLRRSVAEVGQAAMSVAGLAVDAGLEPSLLGPPLAPTADGELDPAEVTRAGDRARAARTLADMRRGRASDLKKLALQAEQAEDRAAGAEERAAESEAEVDGERAKASTARSVLADAEHAWAAAVTRWTATSPAANLETRWDHVLNRLAAREGGPAWVAAVRQSVNDCLASPLHGARQAAAEADLAVVTAEAELTSAEASLAEVESQPEARPAPAPHRDAERDPAAGAPLYELVDIAPGVIPDDAAGLEAALQAAGLLDAWVHSDGLVVHPDTREVLLRTDAPAVPAGAATLADVLVPAPAGVGPVGTATIDAVLRAVGLGDQPGAAWVTCGGRWSLGVLRGAWHKETVEYLGAGARQATRERLLAELRDRVDARREDVARARVRADDAAVHREAVERLPAAMPPADAIDEAAGELRNAERALGSARVRHEQERRRAEVARTAANRLAAAVASEALGEGLPTSASALEGVLGALAELGEALSDHRAALRDLAGAHQRLPGHRAQEADRRAEAAECIAGARQRRAEHHTAAHELATLRDALAATIENVLAKHADATSRLAALDESLLPAAEHASTVALRAHATADAQMSEATTAEANAGTAVVAAGRALEAAVVQPGVMLAATGRDVGQAGDLVSNELTTGLVQSAVALAAAVAPLVDGDDEVSDGTILSRYDRLSESLAGGYDTAIDEHEGVKVVHVADDSGRQPLAAVAARLAAEAEAAKGRLAAREREVFERFLLRELADEVRSKLLDAHDLVTGTNRTLAQVRTSHGKGAHLEWKLRDDAAAPAGVAARLLVDDLRDEDADAELRDALLALIEAERAADPSAGYEQHLRAALDFRNWHRFTVKVTDVAHPGSSRTLSSRLGLSQGEQRVLSYLALFSAAASHFQAIARETPTAPRLLLLDDAFAKVDEPTHGHLLGLLVQLGMDFVLTSERMWGCFPSVPSLEIYEAVRDPAHPGVALVHFRWDGHHRHLVGV
ncbi:MAG: TIGR02680 family protein [Acidimicrobiales bacterium]